MDSYNTVSTYDKAQEIGFVMVACSGQWNSLPKILFGVRTLV